MANVKRNVPISSAVSFFTSGIGVSVLWSISSVLKVLSGISSAMTS